ncbi:MAG: hypothetical protein GX456_03855 [Verrucomicrobia bacterium]|nr:hypothetical protein [Verrucomicrobiota bacterium]
MDRLGAAKNRRAPATGWKNPTAVRSAAVLGRINATTDFTTRLDHSNPTTEHGPVGGGEESPRSRSALENPTAIRSAAVLGRINPATDSAPVSRTAQGVQYAG